MVYLGVDFVEDMYEQGDAPDFHKGQWDNVKDSLGLRFPSLPYLIDGHVKLTDANAIMRYLASKFGPYLLGDTPEEIGRIEMVSTQVTDLKGAVTMPCYTSGDREAITNNILVRVVPFVKFMGKNRFLTGNEVRYIDFTFFELCELMEWISEGRLYTKFPTLKAYSARIKDLPSLTEYWADDRRCMKRPFNNKVAKLNN